MQQASSETGSGWRSSALAGCEPPLPTLNDEAKIRGENPGRKSGAKTWGENLRLTPLAGTAYNKTRWGPEANCASK